MTEITNIQPSFGIAITLICYYIGLTMHKKFNKNYLHPMLIAAVIIIAFLTITKTPYDTYNSGGKLISYLLGPATVALAIPLCRQIKLLKKNIYSVTLGVVTGTITGITTAYFLADILKASPQVTLSLVPKSVTTPIAMEIAAKIGGIPALTACVVIVTGTFGAILGPKILDMIGIRNDIARGIAIGSAAHAMGTNRCLKENELQGAMSGISIALVGTATAILAPIMIKSLT